jgi:hypothetical protein
VTVHGEVKLDICNEMEENFWAVQGKVREEQSRADATDC